MTTRTIRETDIIITKRASRPGYRILDSVDLLNVHDSFPTTFAAALQARADIIDGRAGQPRVGDIVRIGLKGVQRYAVAVVYEDTLGLAYTDSMGTPRTRVVAMDRVHLVEGVR